MEVSVAEAPNQLALFRCAIPNDEAALQQVGFFVAHLILVGAISSLVLIAGGETAGEATFAVCRSILNELSDIDGCKVDKTHRCISDICYSR